MFFVFYWKQMLKIFVNYRKQFLMSCFNKSLQQGCSFERVLPRKEVICFKQSHCCFKKEIDYLKLARHPSTNIIP